MPNDARTVLTILDLTPRRMGSFEEYLCAMSRQMRDLGGRHIVGGSGMPAPDVAEEFTRSGLEWHDVRFQNGLAAAARAIGCLIHETKPHVTHFHFVDTTSPLFLAARIAGAKNIFVSHHYSYTPGSRSRLVRIINGIRRRLTLAPCRCLITPSHYVKDYLAREQRIPAGRIRVVHNGVNLRRFDPHARPSSDIRAEFHIPPDAIIISMVALFIREKGGADLLAAMPRILEHAPQAHVLMIGDGPELPALKQSAEQLRIAGHIHFTGLASGRRLDDLLAATQIATLPCTWGEAFSLVILEYMACAKPIIATAVGGTPEAVAHGSTGLLVPPNSPDRLADAFLGLLSDPARAAAMGLAGRRRAEQLFDVERMVTDTLAIYNQTDR